MPKTDDIETRFRTIDGLSIRFAQSEQRDDHAQRDHGIGHDAQFLCVQQFLSFQRSRE